MSEFERPTVSAFLTALLFLVAAYVIHSSDGFAGSLGGFTLGVTAVILMIAALIYPLTKNSPIEAFRIRPAAARVLLQIHVYGGILGAFVAILHTGHRFASGFGLTLVFLTVVVVLTGFVGRYYVPSSLAELRDNESRLAALRSAFDLTAQRMALRAKDNGEASSAGPSPLGELVESISELERDVGSRRAMKTIFVRWMTVHAAASILLFAFLTVHVAGEIYYGLRWLR